MQHAILELECRKHVQELHISHANKAVFGPTKGPQKSHNKRVKETWSTLKLDKNNMCLFDCTVKNKHGKIRAGVGMH